MKIGELAARRFEKVGPHDGVAAIEERLLREKYLVVMDEDRYLGLLTVSNIIKKPKSLVLDCLDERPSLDIDDDFEQALETMERASVHFLPVREEGRFVGVVSYKGVVSRLQREHERAVLAYREVFDASNDAIFILSVDDCQIMDANQAAVQLTGYPVERLVEMAATELSDGDSTQLSSQSSFWTEFAELEERQTFEWTIQHRDGHFIWTEVGLSPARISARQRLICIVRDITRRKQFEKQQAKLEHAEAVRLIAGGVAHDLNNLAHAAGNILQLIRHEGGVDPRALDRLDDVNSVITRAERLGRQLVLFTKHGNAARDKVHLDRLISENARLMVTGTGVELSVSLDDDLHCVEVSAEQFAQVVHNLVINAVQACKSRGGRIEITGRNVSVTEEDSAMSVPPGSYVELTFEDDGVGIEPELVPTIFDPYLTTKDTGTGLGLAIVWSIVTNHGGFVSVESRLDEGSTFRIYLPSVVS